MISNLHTAAGSDLILLNTSTVISPRKSEACLQLVSVDDQLIEDKETFSVVVVAQNENDRVNGNTTVIIFDNDGMLTQ